VVVFIMIFTVFCLLRPYFFFRTLFHNFIVIMLFGSTFSFISNQRLANKYFDKSLLTNFYFYYLSFFFLFHYPIFTNNFQYFSPFSYILFVGLVVSLFYRMLFSKKI
jgi:hypothetical protein